MHCAFRQQPGFRAFVEDLLEQCHAAVPDNEIVCACILSLRKMSALISIQRLEPDLVIMDEFQRFSTLLSTNCDDEQNMIAHEFFGNNQSKANDQQPLILLLSATPYKPYTTLEELNESNCDAQYEDFSMLMDFLFKNNPDCQFREVWKGYSHSLSQLSAGKFDVLLTHKKNAEDTLYQAMCRTERPNANLIIDTHNVLEISEGDVLSYAHMQKVFEDCRRLTEENQGKGLGFTSVNVPMDYVKSSPYLLSFMDKYELKNKIAKVYKSLRNEGVSLPISQKQQTYLLNADHLEKYSKLNFNNARLLALAREAFNIEKHGKSHHAERLLWIPTSHPYYTIPKSNIFEQNRSFSKILVFSAWEMVPRMIACMLSYEMEKLTINEANKDAKYKSQHQPRLSDGLLCYPSWSLAQLYNPQDYYGQSIADIRKKLTDKLIDKIKAQNPTIEIGGKNVMNHLCLIPQNGLTVAKTRQLHQECLCES